MTLSGMHHSCHVILRKKGLSRSQLSLLSLFNRKSIFETIETHRLHTKMAAIFPTEESYDERVPTSCERVDEIAETHGSKSSEESDVDVVPDGGYGWICVACNFWINASTWGVNSVRGRIISSLSHMQTV